MIGRGHDEESGVEAMEVRARTTARVLRMMQRVARVGIVSDWSDECERAVASLTSSNDKAIGRHRNDGHRDPGGNPQVFLNRLSMKHPKTVCLHLTAKPYPFANRFIISSTTAL
jgi:hypothetical protein